MRDCFAFFFNIGRMIGNAERPGNVKEFTMEKVTMVSELVRLVGRQNVLSSAMHFKLYEYDASLIRSKPDCIVIPTSTEQVAKVVKFAYDNRIPIIARGSGTNLSGGSVSIQGGIAIEIGRASCRGRV